MKKWLPLFAIGLPLLWLGLYAWAWMARHGCDATPMGPCWVSAAAGWGADVVMFRWGDTTLAAGLCAFAGGAFVYFAARQQRLDTLRDRADELRATRLAALAAVSHQVSIFHSQLITTGSAIDASLEGLRATTMRIADFAPGLAQWVLYIGDQINEQFGDDGNPNFDPRREQLRARCYELSALTLGYFTEFDRLLDDKGAYRNVPADRRLAGAYNPDRFPIMEGMYRPKG